MFQLTALYNHPEDAAAFDRHYDTVHAPLAKKIPGVQRFTVSRPAPGPDGAQPPYHLVAVLEFPDGSVRASLPAELRYNGEFYDFESKYLDTSELQIPAKLDDEITESLRWKAITAFRALDVQGLARVDFFVTDDGDITVNEVNTMPGFTPSSAFPKMWAVTGLDYSELLSTMVDTALARGTGLR